MCCPELAHGISTTSYMLNIYRWIGAESCQNGKDNLFHIFPAILAVQSVAVLSIWPDCHSKVKMCNCFCYSCLRPFLSLFHFVPFTQDPSSLPVSFCVCLALTWSGALCLFVVLVQIKMTLSLSPSWPTWLFVSDLSKFALSKKSYLCDLLCKWKDKGCF